MSVPVARIKPVEPSGTRPAGGFACGPGGLVKTAWEAKTYPDSPRGRALRDLRVSLDLSIGDAAQATGLSRKDVSDLENGRAAAASDAGWDALERALRAAKEGA